MEQTDSQATLQVCPQIQGVQRWNVYHRLQQLEIPCHCRPHHPLQVQIDTPTAAIQLWSVLQQLTANRQSHIQRLQRCWQQPAAMGRISTIAPGR